jgi:hypothetical protein
MLRKSSIKLFTGDALTDSKGNVIFMKIRCYLLNLKGKNYFIAILQTNNKIRRVQNRTTQSENKKRALPILKEESQQNLKIETKQNWLTTSKFGLMS